MLVYQFMVHVNLIIFEGRLIQFLHSPHPFPKKKKKFPGWATGLSAGEAEWTLEFSFFKVVIDLTDAGHG